MGIRETGPPLRGRRGTKRQRSGRTMHDEIDNIKRELILQEAARLFAERGYVGTTLDDIARELGVSKPLIYTQFPTKSELLAASFRRIVDLCLVAVEETLLAPMSTTEQLRRLVREIVLIAAHNNIYSKIFLREEKSIEASVLAEVHAKEDRWHAGLQGLLEKGVQNGEFVIPDTYLAALVIGGQIAWLYSGRDTAAMLEPESVADGVADLVLRMVGAPTEHTE